ncbi:MAG: hypothetical protein AUG75_03370 [Cyanobacteria bacterium 13_1_20CM_4_61_6]|nr:MAG: hypothetical protein AUG75_03370 [Cyanobacteria bacterium 13_1_20CM_4_61_6]
MGKQGIVFVIWKGQENAAVHDVPMSISTTDRQRCPWDNFELRLARISLMFRRHIHLSFKTCFGCAEEPNVTFSKHQHYNRGGNNGDSARGLKSIHSRHCEIQNDHIWLQFLSQAYSNLSRLRPHRIFL